MAVAGLGRRLDDVGNGDLVELLRASLEPLPSPVDAAAFSAFFDRSANAELSCWVSQATARPNTIAPVPPSRGD